jgi:hypothetical protein
MPGNPCGPCLIIITASPSQRCSAPLSAVAGGGPAGESGSCLSVAAVAAAAIP